MSATSPHSVPPPPVAPPPRRVGLGYLRASAPLRRWRTVDLLTAAFLGAAFGVLYWIWGLAYTAPSAALEALYRPLGSLTYGPWLLAGVVGGLVVRRPGAAFLCEVVAALVSMLAGTSWGWATLLSGALEGLGAELAFAIFGYAAFTMSNAIFAGALAAPLEAVWELSYYYGWAWPTIHEVVYAIAFIVSGAACGALAWLVVRALASSGALNALPPGQELREAHAH